MEYHIKINGKHIELTEDQVKEIINAYESNPKEKKLADIPVGGTFLISGTQFVVLGQYDEETVVIAKDIVKKMAFGGNNNFAESAVDKFCKEYAEWLAEQIGERNIAEHMVDLTSDDGLKDYGVVTRKVSLLTADQYREYVDILDQHKPDFWWWLATPHSTPRHENETWVKCVSPAGGIYNDNVIYGSYGVRPFCILNSFIFVSYGD